MADYTPEGGRSTHQTLTADEVDTVILGGTAQVEVLNRGNADIYFVVGFDDPVVEGDDTFIARAGQAVLVGNGAGGERVVKLIAAADCAYSVTGI